VTAALELIDVFAGYGKIQVLAGVSLAVASGSVFALLGPNGAGKSTALRVASGHLQPTSGCVHVAGTHVNGMRPHRLARAGVCAVSEGRAIFPNLTVAENLRMMGNTGGGSGDEIMDRAFAQFPWLAGRRSQQAGSMSGGEQQMLAMARAVATDPALLLLDEISMGLAPRIVGELYELVAGLAGSGLSILLVEQFATTALAVADRAAVMVHGRLTHVGPPDDIGEVLATAYLGTGREARR
jgi:branched-chain amino acid transport system ATP-binding protein